MLQKFDEFENFCFKHGGTLRNHRAFGEMVRELRKDLVQLIADAEQCVQAEHQGRDTAIKANPGDWILIGRHLYWVCDCPNGIREDVSVCAVCDACQPVKPKFYKPTPDVR